MRVEGLEVGGKVNLQLKPRFFGPQEVNRLDTKICTRRFWIALIGQQQKQLISSLALKGTLGLDSSIRPRC